MRVLFVARAIHAMAGGVERMIIMLVHAMLERGHQIELFTWDRAGTRAFYPMDPRIRWHRLDLGNPMEKASSGMLVRRMRMIRALVRERRPEVIVCFQEGPFAALRLYTLGLGIPVIAAERNAPTQFDHTNNAWRRKAYHSAFRIAQRVVIQCESHRRFYPAGLRPKIVTISNPVPAASFRANPAQPDANGCFNLLSVGRLSFQKNYEVLIAAFAQLAPRFPDWKLTIVGEGEQRDALSRLSKASGLSGRVSLPGNCAAVDQYYRQANLFCMPSRWEGFPNAVAEALAGGVPAVGFADCAGMSDVIQSGKTGLLAPGTGDADSLASALAELMRDPEKRAAMGAAAVESMTKFDPSRTFDRWEDLLTEATRQ